MGTKRKARGSTSKKATANEIVYNENSKFAPDERFEDSQDEFELGRDHILLEDGPETKRRRKLQEEEEFFQESDEEIHPYDSDDLDDENLDEEEEEDEEGDYEDDEPKQSLAKPRGRKALSPVSEDVKTKEDEEEFLAGWGSKKKDYYDADMIETEADALEEEEEAKKIQLNRLQAMSEADFGFDESEWAAAGQDGATIEDKEQGTITEVLPELQISDDMSKEDRIKIMKQRYPEFDPLAKDFVDLQPVYQVLAAAAKDKMVKSKEDQPSITTVKFRALSAYLGVISMYFVLLTSTAKNGDDRRLAMPPAQLREHPIMEALINCRKQWEEVCDLNVQVAEAKSEGEDVTDQEDKSSEPAENPEEPVVREKPSRKQKKTKAQKVQEEAQALAEKRRAERLKQTEEGLAELSKLLDPEQKKSKSRPKFTSILQDDSDLGDEPSLTAHEAAEKAKKRKSLRFYTSQIAQKANKRNAAGRDAGGDADIPYRERLKDRQARLNAEAEKRGRREANEQERLGGDSDEEDERIAQELRGVPAAAGDDDYYDMVTGRIKEKKEAKRKLAEAQAAAAREGGYVEVQEEIGPDGKRKITYAIEKNKGLAPKRSKDVRNPRVKKRKKFEQKKKRLGSIRQVYKGGEGPGGYGGELTGIKKNLVKSVKL
ncbi:hypothetical protein VTO42DRAFT_4559 [Malbranchea cinnamomea]